LGQNAPITIAPVITLSASGSFSLPVTVNDFNDIGALTLYLEYDPSVITYLNSYSANAALGSAFVAGSVAVSASKTCIVMQWFGFTGVTLSSGSVLCTLNFNFPGTSAASTALKWYDIGPSCEYTDGNGWILNDTPTSSFYLNGSVTFPLSANFIASDLLPPRNTTVSFTDQSSGNPTSWTWSFNRPTVVFVNGTTASSQNPQVQFTDGGLYTVTLVINRNSLSGSLTKTDYLRAGVAGVWTGNISSDWNTASNWDNYLLPGSLNDVVIPASAPNWPVYSGNLTIGVQCKSLNISGVNSKMTVTGILTIP